MTHFLLNPFRRFNLFLQQFFDQLKNDTDIHPSLIKPFIDELALQTQICIKGSKMLYLHGFVLYAL